MERAELTRRLIDWVPGIRKYIFRAGRSCVRTILTRVGLKDLPSGPRN